MFAFCQIVNCYLSKTGFSPIRRRWQVCSRGDHEAVGRRPRRLLRGERQSSGGNKVLQRPHATARHLPEQGRKSEKRFLGFITS